MKPFFNSLLTAVTLVLVTAGLSFGQSVPAAVWPLASSTADSVTSNVAVDTEAVVGLTAGYEVPAAGTALNVQKLKPDAATSDKTNGTGSWPVETALNTARYLQFSFTPEKNYTVMLDSISMLIGAKGIKGMHASVFSSMHSNFSDSMDVSEMGDLIENAVKDTSLSVSDTLMAGDTLFVRVYPWTGTSSTSTSKYVYIGMVAPYGVVMTTPMMTSNGMWDFQSDSLGVDISHRSWSLSGLEPMVAKDTITPSATNRILEITNNSYNSAVTLEAVLPSGKTMADYKSFNFKGYFAQGDVGYKQIFVQAFSSMPGGGFQYKGDTVNNIGMYDRATDTASTNWEDISIPINGSFSMTDTVYIVFGFNAGGTGGVGAPSGKTLPTIWYAESMQLVANTTTASPLTLWGIDPNWNGPGWKLNVTDGGDSANFHGGVVKPWAGIRGAFKHPLVGTTAKDGAIVVSGKVTFVGEAPDVGSGMRYGIYNHLHPGVLTGASSDSAYWKGMTTAAYGYTFSPQSGTDETPGSYSFGGSGAAQWIVMGGDWLSSYGGAIGFGPYVIQQAPARATMGPGTYEFAFSVHPQANGTKLVKYYLIQKNSQGNIIYWDAASLTDTTSQMRSDTLNAIEFGVEGGANMTGMVFSDVVDSLGPDITIPTEPWSPYYLDQSSFAFYGNRTGGWELIPGGGYGLNSVIGNVTLEGDTSVPKYQSMAVRGAFVDETAPRGPDSNVVVTGDLDFIGGGFSTPNSFLFGLFNSDSAGTVNKSDTTHYAWTGTEGANSGYLFIAPSGNGAMPQWPGGVTSQYLNGDAGAVVNGVWLSTVNGKNYMLGNTPQYPAAAVPQSGMYHFRISAGPNAHGVQQVRYVLFREPDTNYVFQGSILDTHNPVTTTQFNSIDFALLGGNSTDTLKIENVQVNLGMPDTLLAGKITGVTNTASNLPKTFALYQNYPNPFNPSTVISYALPKASRVSLKVYNVLGQEVATVVNSKQTAGIHKVTFNMDNYASGVYFVRMTAGSFVHTEKMMLLK